MECEACCSVIFGREDSLLCISTLSDCCDAAGNWCVKVDVGATVRETGTSGTTDSLKGKTLNGKQYSEKTPIQIKSKQNTYTRFCYHQQSRVMESPGQLAALCCPTGKGLSLAPPDKSCLP